MTARPTFSQRPCATKGEFLKSARLERTRNSPRLLKNRKGRFLESHLGSKLDLARSDGRVAEALDQVSNAEKAARGGSVGCSERCLVGRIVSVHAKLKADALPDDESLTKREANLWDGAAAEIPPLRDRLRIEGKRFLDKPRHRLCFARAVLPLIAVLIERAG